MPKWLRYGSIALASVIVASIALTVVINSIDQKLRPEVKKILDKPLNANETQKRAYFFVLGLYSGEKENPEKKGSELWEQRDKPGFWKSLEHTNYFKVERADCGQGRECTVKDLEEHPELTAKLTEHKELLTNYIKLMQYGEGITLFRGNKENIFAPISALPYHPHSLFLLQLTDWLRKGGQLRVIDLLIASNHYARSFLSQSTLLESMLATVMLSKNAAFVKAELQRNPKFPVTQELIESFNLPRTEDVLFGALDTETQFTYKALQSINTFEDLERSNLGGETTGETTGPLSLIPTRLLFRPNETINRYYEITSQVLTADCFGNIDYLDCVPGARWAEPKYPWSWMSNPVGRVLVRMTSISIGGIREKMERRRNDIAIVQEMIREKI